MDPQDHGEPIEIAMVGDLTDSENELSSKLLDVLPGGECTLFIDSPGGSPYSGLSLMSLILLRGIRATGIVTGECSSAALWPFAACKRRFVTPYSVLLFHPMKWQSEEHVGLAEAAEWARHFGQLETEMDQVLAGLFNVSDEEMARLDPPRSLRLRARAGVGRHGGIGGLEGPQALRAQRRQPRPQAVQSRPLAGAAVDRSLPPLCRLQEYGVATQTCQLGIIRRV